MKAQQKLGPDMINLHDENTKNRQLPIFNTSDCIMKIILAGTGVIFFLRCSLNNERAYDFMLPQEGDLS